MLVIQLTESIPVETPLGPGMAVLFETGEHDNHWTVILESRAFVTFPQSEILASRSYYPRRGLTTEQMKELIRDRT